MPRKLIKTSRKSSTPKTTYEEVETIDVGDIAPSEIYIVTVDVEDTKFLVILKDTEDVICLSMDEDRDTIRIPLKDFNKGVWKYADGERNGKVKYSTTKITVHKKN
jgi:hypothetical protein